MDKLAAIEELTIRHMENLMEIWPGELEAKLRKMTVILSNGLSSILFPSNSIKGMQNLEALEVEDCRSIDFLRNLFSYSLAKLLVKLREIKVTEYCMMESIIGNEPSADDAVITNMIIFPQLTSLKLSNLPNLSSFYSEACKFEGSLLKTIEVINCPKMKILPLAFQCKLEQQKLEHFSATSSQLHLLDGKFIFSNWFLYDFGKLTITDINGSIEMWHNQLEADCLDKEIFMLVQFCGKLSNVISSNLIQRLRDLRQLKVWWCDSLETIFDLQGSVRAGTTSEEGSSIIGFRDMKLMCLPKLTHIWKNVSQQTHWFKYLKSLEVERIGNCEKIEKIVSREEEEEEDGDDERGSKITIFSAELENLPNIVCIGIPESQIRISKLHVDFCPKYREVMMWKGPNIYHLLLCIANLFVEKADFLGMLFLIKKLEKEILALCMNKPRLQA
ncbi:unnamed protein product [Camellia sinensis]